MSDLAWRSVGNVGCPEASQHVIEVLGDLTLVALLALLRRHSGKVNGAMKLNSGIAIGL
jgi:hypothetical protein